MRSTGNGREARTRAGGSSTWPGARLTARILSVLTALGGIWIIANFGKITAKLAIWSVRVLSFGTSVLIVAVVIAALVIRIKWRLRGRLWRW